MLVRRKIELRPNAAGLPQTVISRKDLEDCGLAQEVLSRSQRMADDLLSCARAEAETVLDSARQAFWDVANAQLDCWQRAHAALSKGVEASACVVVNQALLQLLDELPPSARISALLEHLVRAQYPPLIATLRCHPHVHAQVQRWLSAQPHTLWQLQTDSSLEAQALVLVTPDADLRIDWPTALESLRVPVVGTDHCTPATE